MPAFGRNVRTLRRVEATGITFVLAGRATFSSEEKGETLDRLGELFVL